MRNQVERRGPWKKYDWTALRDPVSLRALVPIGVSASVQSSPRPGQVERRDYCSDDPEEEPPADHPGNPKCLPFRGEDYRRTSCDVDDSPDDHRERGNTNEDQHVSSFYRSADPSYVRNSLRSHGQSYRQISEHRQNLINVSSKSDRRLGAGVAIGCWWCRDGPLVRSVVQPWFR
jgi:hypothetical protein